MPLAQAAIFGGVAHSLWSYNRENWQWDWQVRQACEFQRQNMAVSRYSLFREDIRDLAALTVNKMDSYLIVNTLKLGFIVTIFLNYDRADSPQYPGYMERQVTLLFSVCFLTSFLFLLISIWLSMHASIVAQSFTTKMLLQAARIPVASDEEIASAVPAAKAYETSLDDAFRLPLSGARRERSPVPWAPGNGSPVNEAEDLESNPHLKFYSLLMRNWQTFDLYSKVCMSIGTSSLLSGIAYYATYFSRSRGGNGLDPYASGWFCFVFMSVLAWWSVTIDVVLQRLEHAWWALVSLSGPITAAVAIIMPMQSLMPLAALLQGCWLWLLCGSALALRDGLPRRWRASLYIDILNPFKATCGSLAPSSRLSRAPPVAAAAAAEQLLNCLEAVLKEPQLPPEPLEQIRSCQVRLQEVLSDLERPPLGKASGKGVRRTLSEGAAPRGQGFWLSFQGDNGSCRTWVAMDSTPLFRETTVGELLETAAVLLRAMRPSTCSWTARDAHRLAAYGGSQDAADLTAFEAQFRTKGRAAKSSMGRSARRFFQASCLVVSIAWLLAPVASLIINRQPRARHEAVVPLRRLRTLPLPRPWLQVRAASCSGQRLAVSDGLRAYSWNGTWQGPMAHCDGAPVASVGLSGERLYAGGEDRMLWPLQRCPQRHSEFEAIALDQLQGLALWNGELVMLEPHGDAWQVAGALPQPPKHDWRSLGINGHEAVAISAQGELFFYRFPQGEWHRHGRLDSSILAACSIKGRWQLLAMSQRELHVSELQLQL